MLRPLGLFFCFTIISVAFLAPANAYEVGARIRATGGVHQVEGAAGGGIVPWALIAGYGQSGEWSVNAFSTVLTLDDYNFAAAGISVGISNRVELSLARHQLDISEIGLPVDDLTQDSIGAKVRLFNNLIYDTWPQISVGVQHKKNDDFTIPGAVGALDDSGTDIYLAASKLWLSGLGGYPLLLNTTARLTNGNQLGLLGYGGDLNKDEEWMLEVSGALLLSHSLVIGAEYRQKPNNLSFAEEEDWRDVFIAWFPSKHISLTAAYAELGNIAVFEKQSGFYFSVQGTL